jgi:hypothetical protein
LQNVIGAHLFDLNQDNPRQIEVILIRNATRKNTMISSKMNLIMHGAIVVAATFSVTSFALGQSNNTAWTDKLSKQLASEKQCEVAFFTQLVEITKGGKIYYSARSQCVDGRQFDGERLGDDAPFSIKACEVNVC